MPSPGAMPKPPGPLPWTPVPIAARSLAPMPVPAPTPDRRRCHRQRPSRAPLMLRSRAALAIHPRWRMPLILRQLRRRTRSTRSMLVPRHRPRPMPRPMPLLAATTPATWSRRCRVVGTVLRSNASSIPMTSRDGSSGRSTIAAATGCRTAAQPTGMVRPGKPIGSVTTAVTEASMGVASSSAMKMAIPAWGARIRTAMGWRT